MASILSSAIVQDWLQSLQRSKIATTGDRPDYWKSQPDCLVATSDIHGVDFGTGHELYTRSILPAIAAADSEVILVTCFWARSATLEGFNRTLIDLSAKALQNGRKIRVRICFSSLSLLQKLLHPQSLRGKTYSPSQWRTKFGLPNANELEGLDLEVKSIFVLPFSVMHPKFVIIDRRTVFSPSCNVSWENWFEGCIEFSGPLVQLFVNFWTGFWANNRDKKAGYIINSSFHDDIDATHGHAPISSVSTELSGTPEIQAVLLPSPHHRNPKLSLVPFSSCPVPPATPLNTFLLSALAHARRDIYIQTPNLTSPPVLYALLAALKRGVNVEVLTSQRLMILEQLVTAGTTTHRCVKKLVKRHKELLQESQSRSDDLSALESGHYGKPGSLSIFFYEPDPAASKESQDRSSTEPTQSHLKLTIIDGEWTILGSGNMDRASWYTSQELGVAWFSAQLTGSVRRKLDPLLATRKKFVYNGVPV